MLKSVIIITISFSVWQAAHSQQLKNPYFWLQGNKKCETIATRFQVPEGFKRVEVRPKSFAQWLRELPLLSDGRPVKDYTGRVRRSAKDTTLAAVVDYNIKGKKLEQCMDIIFRWRAEYLRSQNRSQDIAFFLPGGFLLKWTDWMKGFRPVFKGINVNLHQTKVPDSSRLSFEKYLWEIFYHSYTQTAYVAYPKVNPQNIQIGDFVVKKGTRGHAVLIVDMAEDQSGKKIALIGQGDKPARQFYLLNYKKDQPWFPLNPKDEHLPLPIRKKLTWDGVRRF